MASNQMKVWGFARQYQTDGFSLIPCNGKKPVKDWKVYTLMRASGQTVDRWYHPTNGVIKPYQSIGLVGGAISGNIVFVDLDGIPAIRKFASQFPKLAEQTKSILTGSQEGIHLYFRVKDMPNNTNVRVAGIGGFEIRGNGQYVIAPPSIHPSGHEYRVYRDNPILQRDNMNDVYDWMQSLRENEQSKRQAEISRASGNVNVSVSSKRKGAFLKKVFSEEIARVKTSSEGNRNESLFYAALRLANYAAGGELSWDDCKSALLLATELPFSEAYRTVESAWKIGRKYPKVVK